MLMGGHAQGADPTFQTRRVSRLWTILIYDCSDSAALRQTLPGRNSLDDVVFETEAPSPDRADRMVKLVVEPERVRQLASLSRKTPLFELCYNVCGFRPPVNNIGYHEEGEYFPDHWGGLKHTHAIFRGLKRPMTEEGLDGTIYVYLVSPRFTYRFFPHMVCCAKREKAPDQAVFAAYVNFIDDDWNQGVILNWEWVAADPENCLLPDNYRNRYEQEVWRDG